VGEEAINNWSRFDRNHRESETETKKWSSLRTKSVGVETVPPERTTDVQFQLSH